MKDIGGIVPLWKPRGMTSFDAVQQVRRIYQTKKAGHTGTLDPDVEGVLLVCLNRATKLVEYLTGEDKVYEGEVTFGTATDTEDSSGTVTAHGPVPELTNADADHLLASFTGSLMQTPPMYSAVKINGKKLYEYAREGRVIDRPAREVFIHELSRQGDVTYHDTSASFRFRVRCSKGTFIRTLCVQFGHALSTEAHMSDLIRTRSGSMDANACVGLETLRQHDDPEQLLLPMEQAVDHLHGMTVDEETRQKILHGGLLRAPEGSGLFSKPYFPVYDQQGHLLALYKWDEKREGMIKPEKMIRTADQKEEHQ
ncbi:tRNA pseudouridine(55) synthase TruB [Alkalicoccus chagannorensis]|uniref:tRNA pseudouridine(55) synthase TruB n=1 Tax=Alkalicoccus chagannorensis TaxID=427072 RepID=UPI000684CC45|nr:tRNA pseudouridine(55) synthase TruB [Alkalicoccus chagannorensis]